MSWTFSRTQGPVQDRALASAEPLTRSVCCPVVCTAVPGTPAHACLCPPAGCRARGAGLRLHGGGGRRARGRAGFGCASAQAGGVACRAGVSCVRGEEPCQGEAVIDRHALPRKDQVQRGCVARLICCCDRNAADPDANAQGVAERSELGEWPRGIAECTSDCLMKKGPCRAPTPPTTSHVTPSQCQVQQRTGTCQPWLAAAAPAAARVPGLLTRDQQPPWKCVQLGAGGSALPVPGALLPFVE